jgi:hypothetical protein
VLFNNVVTAFSWLSSFLDIFFFFLLPHTGQPAGPGQLSLRGARQQGGQRKRAASAQGPGAAVVQVGEQHAPDLLRNVRQRLPSGKFACSHFERILVF